MLAAAVLWLLFTDPVTVATTANGQQFGPMLASLARTLGDALLSLLSYL